MKLTFLGTGGGRFMVIYQKRATGGTIIEMDGEMIHFDPGPGALVKAAQYGVDLQKLTGIIISHAHPDHYTDAEFACIAMTKGAREKRGFFLANDHVINGSEDGNYRSVVSKFILNMLNDYKIMEPGTSYDTGKIKITAVKAKHSEPKSLGYVIEGSEKLGLTGDGEYYKGQEDAFKGCEYLVINCLRPRNSKWPEHMTSEGAGELVSKVKPKIAILKDLGLKMLNGVAEKEAKWIEEQTGIKIIVAEDGMKFSS